jgi:aromatic ring hydroxylase
MAARSGRQFLDSLHDDRAIWIDGERVLDVTQDYRFAAAARSMAELYDMQHDPALRQKLTYPSPTSGERVGLSFIQPRSIEDIVRRREMVKTWMDATCGMFGRSPDFMNIMITGFACAADAFGAHDRKYSDNVSNYYLYCRENDLAMTHTLVNPQVDRSKPVEKQDKDLAAKIVKETDAGMVINGARMVSTLCAYAHELLVMPSTYLARSRSTRRGCDSSAGLLWSTPRRRPLWTTRSHHVSTKPMPW